MVVCSTSAEDSLARYSDDALTIARASHDDRVVSTSRQFSVVVLNAMNCCFVSRCVPQYMYA